MKNKIDQKFINQSTQKIIIFQQKGRAKNKIKWIKEYKEYNFQLKVISIKDILPPIIDTPSEYIPKTLDADLILDYLEHPDLTYSLVELCNNQNIPIISSGKKITTGKNYSPPVCCALPRSKELGAYSEHFGIPEIKIFTNNNLIASVEILHGSPCGSTWKAATEVIGTPIKDAATKFGLYTQFFCTANPANWDPINSGSPVHLAANIHKTAFTKALKKNKINKQE